MLHEHGPRGHQPSPEPLFILQDSLFSIWYKLPTQDQLTILFDLIRARNNPESLEWGIDEQLIQSEDQYKQPNHNGAEERNNFEDFSSWMETIDCHVWMLAGCSVYDLSNCDFSSMFEAGFAPAEVANNIVIESGVGFG